MGIFDKLLGIKEPELPKETPKAPPPDPAYRDRPNDLNSYPPEVARQLIKIKADIEALIRREDETLESFGLPVPQMVSPTQVSPVTYNGYHLESVTIKAPTFQMPYPLVIPICRNQEEFEQWEKNSKPWQIQTTYALNPNVLITTAPKIQGVWLNRHPYALYNVLTTESKYFGHVHVDLPPLEKRVGSIRPTGTRLPAIDPLIDISGLAPFPAKEMIQIEQRLSFYLSLVTDCLFGPDSQYLNFQSAVNYVRSGLLQTKKGNDIAFNLQLPEQQLPDDLTTIQILPELGARLSDAKSFLRSLQKIKRAAVFEIVNASDTISFQLSCSKEDLPYIKGQIETHFAKFAVVAASAPPELPQLYQQTALPTFPYRSLHTFTESTIDPYAQLFAVLNNLKSDDYFSYRVTFAPVPESSLNTAINDLGWWGEDRGKELKKKFPPFLACITLTGSSKAILEKVTHNFLPQYETPEIKWQLTPIIDTVATNLDIEAWKLLSCDELAGLVHFPGKEITSDRLEITSMKAKLPPPLYTSGGIHIGTSEARGQVKEVHIPESARDRHTYLVGKTGTGKSTIIKNAAKADIDAGRGLAVIDPHGDLVEALLDYIPEERIKDTIYFNAADKEHPIPLNILDAQSEDEIDTLAEDLIVTFKRTADSWGDKMHAILLNTFHTLLRARGATFLDIGQLLTNGVYRDRVLAEIDNPQLTNYWHHEYSGYSREAQPILTRMHKYTLNKALAQILGGSHSSINFYDLIEEKKIFLANISKGALGQETSKLLGSILVSQIQLAAMRQALLPEEFRNPFYLYVDEFQNFTSSAFETILSEARKYKLCLTLAHQFINQVDREMREAIFGNVGTKIIFTVGHSDAEILRYDIGSFEARDLTELPKYHALCIPNTSAKETFSFKTLPPAARLSESNREAIITHTRETYSAEGRQAQAVATPPLAPVEEAPKPAPPPRPRPLRAQPLEFSSVQDKLLHFINLCEYLSTPEIVSLCNLKPSNASENLIKLRDAGKLKEAEGWRPKVYYTGKTCNPTEHNLKLRALFTKIFASGYQIEAVNFKLSLGSLNPDLAVDFLAEDHTLIKTFWEYDTGTEGLPKLQEKIERYLAYANDHTIIFVFKNRQRLEQVAKAFTVPYLVYAVLDEFTTLDDKAFLFTQDGDGAEARSFFG